MAGATVVKEVQAKMTAKSDLLMAELERIVAKSKQAKSEIEGGGAAASTAGAKYAGGARQIAMATETIARMGKVTGESGKQIVAQAANIAFAFGAGGAAVGALGIFGLAIHQMWTRAKREAAEAREEFEKTIRVITQNRDYRQAGQLLTSLLAGDPTSENEADQQGLFRMRDRVRRERAALSRRALPGGGFVITADRADVMRVQALERELARLEERYTSVQATFNRTAELETQRLAALKRLADDEKASDEARAEAKRQIKEALEAEARAAEELTRSIASFETQFGDLLLETFGTASEKATASIDKLIAKAHELDRDPGEIALLEELRSRAIAAAEALQRAEGVAGRIAEASERGVLPMVQDFVALNAEIARLEAQLEGLGADSALASKLRAEIERLKKIIAEMQKGVANANPNGTTPERTAEMARSIQQAVDGALQLAMAFGGVDDELGNVLRSLGQIVGNIPALTTAISKGSGLGIIGASLPILGALASLVGESPEEKQRREEIRANTEALERLTKEVGHMGLGLSGSGASDVGMALARFLANESVGVAAGVGRVNARDLARSFGLNMSELDEIARALGITLNGNLESFQQLAEALGLTITTLGEFGDSLDAQRQQAEAAIEIMGITDPVAQFNVRRGALSGRSPALDALFAGIDVNTAAGREELRKRAQGLFGTMQAGGGSLSAGQLGDLTGDQLLQAILDIIGGLNAIDQAQGTNTSTVGQGDRVISADRTQITADQASRLIGISTSQLAELRMIREAITGASGPMPVPNLRAGFSGGGGAGVTLTITQHYEFHGPVTDPRAVGTEIGEATVEQIDRALGGRLRIQRLHTGNMVTR